MFRSGTDKCGCPHTDCRRNGKCDECSAYHGKNMTYCQKNLRRKSESEKKPITAD